MIRWFRDLSIKHKLLYIFSVQILLPLSLMGFMYFLKISNFMEVYSTKAARDTLIQVELRIKDFRQNVNRVSKDLLYNKDTYSILGNKSNDLAYQTKIMGLRDFINNRMQSSDEIMAVAMVDLEKIKPIISENRGDMDLNIADILPRFNFESKLNQTNNLWYLKTYNKEQFLFFVSSINDLNTYQPLGYVAILSDLNALKESYKDFFADLLQNVFIFTEQGDIVFGAKELAPKIIKELRSSVRGTPEAKIPERFKHLRLSHLRLTESDWDIISAINEKELISDFLDLRTWLIFIFIPVVLLLALLSILTSLDILDPIERLATKMKLFHPEDEFQCLELQRKDELGSLTTQFNQMALKMKDLIRTVTLERQTREKAQLKALHSQINPHFLFNTLQAISGEARLKNEVELSEMIMALSSLLEVSIGRDTKMISLKKELQYVENYLYIMKIRYPDRFDIQWKLDHTLLNIQVPSLMLQPVIENAFQHGILKSKQKGLIKICIKKNNDSIKIEIADNACALSDEKIFELNALLVKNFSEKENESGKSIGLLNVNQRLKLIFGEKYGLNFLKDSHKELRVTISLPDLRRVLQ